MGGMPRAVRARWQRLPDRLDGTTVGWRGFAFVAHTEGGNWLRLAFVAHAEGEAGGTLRLWRMREAKKHQYGPFTTKDYVCGTCNAPQT